MIKTLKALVLGDVVGQPGCRALFWGLQSLIKKRKADLVIVNGENAADGFGMTPGIVEGLFKAGADVITSGNHIWQHHEILPFLETEDRLLRPENYPPGVSGKGYCTITKKEVPIAVLNLEGRMHLSRLRCPFRVGKELINRLKKKTHLIIVDFHAETLEEKEALAIYLDGQITALIGTHTHVQTADEKILRGGTGYITDIGMTGPKDSVIGMKREISLKRSLTQMPLKMEVEDTTPVIMGVLLEIEVSSGKTLSIERFQEEFPALR